METVIDGKTYILVDQNENESFDACIGCAFISIDFCYKHIGGECTENENINKVWKLKE